MNNSLKTVLNELTNKAGSQRRLAKQLGVHFSTLSHALQGRGKLPPRIALALERMSGGRITRYEIAPEVFGQRPKLAGLIRWLERL